MRPGSVPDQVMDAARAACGHHVDATDVAITGGVPRILLRFTVPSSGHDEEDHAAHDAATRMRTAVEEVADVGRRRLLRRRQGSWLPVL